MPSTSQPPLPTPHLGHTFLTRAWIFQAVISSPVLLILGFYCFVTIYDGHAPIYDFVIYLGNTILAAAVVFIVLVHRKVQTEAMFLRTSTGRKLGFYFEVGKSVAATGLWGWILLDAIFGPSSCDEYLHRDPYYHDPFCDYFRQRRVRCCLIASVLPVFFWYPPVVYSGYVVYRSRPGEEQGGGEREFLGEGEYAPLLGNRGV